MPNICTGFMNVRGYKDNVDEFVKILQADYSYMRKDYMKTHNFDYILDPSNFSHIPHFFRVFQADLVKEEMVSGVFKGVTIDLEVAWSIWTCMFAGPHTYYDDMQKEHYNNHFASHILQESKRLQLEMEIWSYEPGMCFQEHYKICSGILVKNEEFKFNYYCLEDMSYDEFKSELGNKYPWIKNQKQYYDFREDNKEIETDVHEEKVDFLPEDNPIYLANLVMVKMKGE